MSVITISLDRAEHNIVRDILENYLVTCQDAIREFEIHMKLLAGTNTDIADWWKNRAARTETILKQFEQ